MDAVEAARVLQRLQSAGVHLWQEEGRLRYRATKGALTSELRTEIAGCREHLLHLLGAGLTRSHAPVRRRDVGQPVPLTPAQAAIWVAERSGIAGDAFHISAALELHGPLDRDALRKSFDLLAARHEALRTLIEVADDKPRQRVLHHLAAPWTAFEVSDNDAGAGEAALPAWLQSLSEPSFQLDRAPLWRVGLARLRTERHVLAVVLHHLVADGGSVAVLMRELSAAYAALKRGVLPPLAPQPLGFPDVALWFDERAADVGGSLAAFWREALSGAPATIDLWPDFRCPATGRLAAELARASLDGRTLASLQRIAAEEGVTLFVVLWALFAVLLHRYGGGDDITMATALSGRDWQELAGVVGLLTNRVPLRADFSDDPTFRAVLRRAAGTVRDAFAHAELPFEQIVRSVGAASQGARQMPFAQILFVLHNVAGEPPAFPLLETRTRDIGTRTTKADLYLSVEIRPSGLDLALEYAPALFERRRMERLLAHYGRLAGAVAENLDVPVSRLPLMDDSFRAHMLSLATGDRAPVSPEDIFTRFRRISDQFPHRTALIAPRSWEDPDLAADWPLLSYGELLDRARQLSCRLDEAGSVVAVCLPRSAELIIALLGVVASGSAYLVLDADLPPAHVQQLREQARLHTLIVGSAGLPAFAGLFGRVIDLSEALSGRAGLGSPSASIAAAAPERLAYVMFTSGSTGKPKGVAVTNRNVLHFVDALPRRTTADPAVFLHFAPCSFDASVMEIWGALLTGATLLVAPPGLPHLAQLAALIEEGEVNFAWLTAGLFHAMIDFEPDALLGIDHLVAGGDVLSPEKLRVLFAARPNTLPKPVIANGYGPTETTVLAAYHEVREDDLTSANSIPLGRPLGRARLYCVDRRGEPTPPGVPGELWIGGDGVAAGYIGQPELTAERFCRDPFAPETEARLYRTGDRARFRDDGTVEFLGRLDQQIKIRGFRVEPGEIEACLLGHPDIAQVAVTAPALPGSAERRLIAYFVARAGALPEPGALRAYLAARLPPHMLPGHFFPLPRLPLTGNGKLDRSALPLPAHDPTASASAPAQDPAELALGAIWKELLGLPEVGLDDGFFELGGDSIRAMQLAMRAARAGWRLSAYDALRYQTLREQARVARLLQSEQAGIAVTPINLTPIQHWFFSLPMQQRVPWNQAVRLVLDFGIDRDMVAAALTELEACHEALRLRFRRQGNVWLVETAPPTRPIPDLLDLSGLTQEERLARIAPALARLHGAVDLGDGPVWRALWIEHGSGRNAELVLTAHHLVIDAVSWRILLEDLARLLAALRDGNCVTLPRPPATLGDWSSFLQARAAAAASEADLWCARAAPPRLLVPPGDGADVEALVDTVGVTIDEAVSAALLRAANAAWRTTTPELLLTALVAGYEAATGARELLVDLEHHGRTVAGAPDLSRTIGWFTTIAPLLVSLPPELDGWCDRVLAVKETVRRLPDSGIGFGLLRYLGTSEMRERLSRLPRPEVSFNYLGQIEARAAGDACFRLAEDDVGPVLHPDAPRPYRVEIVAVAENGRLRIDWRFARNLAAREVMLRWSEAAAAALKAIAAASAADADGRISPSDVVLARGAIRPRQDHIDRSLAAAGLPARRVSTLLCPTPQQQGVLFESLSRPSGIHVEQFLISLAGPLDCDRLERAWRTVVNRHAVLRSAFLWRNTAQPLQAVLREVEPAWTRLDLSRLPAPAQRRQIDDWLMQDSARGFALDAAPLLRLALFRIGERDWVLGWSFHHILLDGWSVALVLAAVMEAYQRADGDDRDQAGAMVIQADYLAWLARQPERDAEEFWKSELEGMAPIRPLGLLDPSPASGDGYEESELVLDASTSESLMALARREGVSLNTVVQAAWASLIARFGEDDVVFGVTVSGRPQDLDGSEDAVGLFVNTLPLRLRLPRQGPLRPWLREVQERSSRIRRFEHFGTARVHAWSGLPARASLFDSLIVYENYPFDRVRSAAARSVIAVTDQEVHGARTRFALTLLVIPGPPLRFRLVTALARVRNGEGIRYLEALRRVLDYMAISDSADFGDLPAVLPRDALPRARVAGLPHATAAEQPPGNAAELAIAALWQDVLGPTGAGIDASFFEIGGHSLLALEFLQRWQQRFGSALSIAEFLASPTIRGLACRLSGETSAVAVKLVGLSNPAPLPLYLAPGASGNPFAYRTLARALEPRHGLVAYGAEDLMDRDGVTIEDLGGDLARAIIDRQPEGAIRLAGHSLGAAVAYAAAETLQTLGRRIESLAIIDLDAPGTALLPERDEARWLSEIVEATARYFDKPLRIPADLLAAMSPEARRRLVCDRMIEFSILPAGSNPMLVDRLLQRYRAAFAALAAWRPRSLHVPVLVVRSEATRSASDTLGWESHCTDLRSVTVAGDHISMILDPHVRDLASVLAGDWPEARKAHRVRGEVGERR
jgi:amino acid adenylation domain-containing protein/non-ribosomal peptide synthase protein (TIGR01720 family)